MKLLYIGVKVYRNEFEEQRKWRRPARRFNYVMVIAREGLLGMDEANEAWWA